MTRTPPIWLVRGALAIIVVITVLVGRWAIPSSIGVLPRIVVLALLVLGVLWLVNRVSRRPR